MKFSKRLLSFLGLIVPMFISLETTAQTTGHYNWINPPEQKGIALGLFKHDPDGSYKHFLKEIKKTGASHVAIVVSHYIKTSHHSTIYSLPGYTAPNRTVAKTIDQAHRLGLKVFLFPILRVEDKSNGGWRGTLAPRDLDLFFKSYKAYISQFAVLAARHNVELLSVGSELATMDIYLDRWTDVINKVRSIFPGPITYSANWDHYEKVPFFSQLDYLGVTGYFALSNQKPPYGENPQVAALTHSWREVHSRLMRWQYRHNKPILFTEVGYLSQKGAASAPWAEGADEPVDLEIQRRCYEAFIRVWNGEYRLAGAYFWNWYDWDGENDREYTPRDKPAAQEIKKWYSQGGPAPTISPAHQTAPK